MRVLVLLLLTLAIGWIWPTDGFAHCLDSLSLKEQHAIQEASDTVEDLLSEGLSEDRLAELQKKRERGQLSLAESMAVDLAIQRERLRSAIQRNHDLFLKTAQEYLESAQIAAGYWDLMRGRLRDRAAWSSHAQDESDADTARDGAWSVLIQILQAQEHLGLSQTELKPYYESLQLLASSANFDDATSQLKYGTRLGWTALVGLPVALVVAVPKLAQGFLWGMAARIGMSLESPIIGAAAGKHDEVLCEIVRSVYRDLPEMTYKSILTSPLGFLPLKKVPWKIKGPILGLFGVGAGAQIYQAWRRHQEESKRSEAVDKLIDGVLEAVKAPSTEERIERARRGYREQMGQEMSEADVQLLRQVLSR